MTTRWFRSKVDTWLAVVLTIGPIVSLAGALMAPPTPMRWVGPLIMAVVYGGLVFPMRYGIGERDLIVRFGLLRRRIPLVSITTVTPTRNPLSSPALSLDRLRVAWGNGRAILISPAERSVFLRELSEARARAARRDG